MATDRPFAPGLVEVVRLEQVFAVDDPDPALRTRDVPVATAGLR